MERGERERGEERERESEREEESERAILIPKKGEK